MALLRAQVRLQRVSLTPEDVTVNTWHFNSEGASITTSMTDITTNLNNFYQAADNYLSPVVATTGHTVTYYALSDPIPRAPLRTDTLAAISPGTTALPDEVAMCVSFKATAASGEPPARKKGRIFIGPLNTTAAGTTTNGNRPSAACISALQGAGSVLLAASIAATTWEWQVYSRVDDAGHPVVAGWVDNAFDTQRRRGVAPTSRSTF